MISTDVAYGWSRNAHLCGGALFAFFFFGLPYFTPAILLGVSAAAVKEFWYDQYYETPEERGSNLVDFSEYLVGAAIGIALAYGKTRL